MVSGTDGDSTPVVQVPHPSLVVLVGPSSAGKSTWATEHFAPEEIVSSDDLRAVVGHGRDDLDATDDAFALLDTIVDHRLRRGLTAVVDTLGLDPAKRAQYRSAAERYGVPCVAVAFDITAAACRERNRQRARPLPADAIKQQLARWAEAKKSLDGEGFASVLRPAAVRHVTGTAAAVAAPPRTEDQQSTGLRFGLHLSAFDWPGDQAALADALRTAAAAAEAAGFHSVWVMDHVRQIPQVGRDWDPMLECYTTLAWLAGVTTDVRLGALVTPITFRNVAHLAKIIATLDVLSGGRAICGLGLGWYEREHRAYGWDFPAVGDRYALLEDALRALPMLWGAGAKPFAGRAIDVPETICYPRPIQAHIPILVGGGGEKRTLRLAAEHADAINVLATGADSISTVQRKVAALREHCARIERDPTEVAVTVLAPTLVGTDRSDVRDRVDRLRPQRVNAARYSMQVNAGTVEDQIDRCRALQSAGVDELIVSLPDLGTVEPVEPISRFAGVIAALAAGA